MSCTSHVQRCSEQMVLLAKAYSVLDAALRPYVFDQALTNTEPSQELERGKTILKMVGPSLCIEELNPSSSPSPNLILPSVAVELETKELQKTCLEKARHVQKVLEHLPEKEVTQVSM